ncbi:MAG TPA: CD1845 family protein [Faecalibacterium prausnitzii]|nr:CD1845 family protein [Faecalibacterium prausnitzii]
MCRPADDCLCDPDGAGCRSFFTPTPIGGIVFLFLAFLLSPYGLQAAAGSLLWALDGGKSALYRFLAS